MEKRNVIQKKDFEHYELQLPVKVILNGKTQNYLYSQLEKNHPCFSEEWCFNSKMKISKKGVSSDVLVIKKLTLADYKKKSFVSRILGFFDFEGIGKRFFFNRKRFLGIIILCVLLISGGICVLQFRKNDFWATENQGKNIISESYNLTENSIPAKNNRCEKVNEFLNCIEKLHGRLDDIQWSSDGVKESFVTTIKNVFYEDLSDFLDQSENLEEKSVITYTEGNPSFRIKISDWCESSETVESQDRNQFSLQIRRCLNSYGVEIQEEKLKPYTLTFRCPEYKEMNKKNALMALNELAELYDYCISKISLHSLMNTGEFDGFSGEIQFDLSRNYKNGINLNPLGWRLNLLVGARKSVSDFTSRIIYAPEKKSEEIAKEKLIGIKLGEIHHSDGTITKYYKNQEGKLIWKN